METVAIGEAETVVAGIRGQSPPRVGETPIILTVGGLVVGVVASVAVVAIRTDITPREVRSATLTPLEGGARSPEVVGILRATTSRAGRVATVAVGPPSTILGGAPPEVGRLGPLLVAPIPAPTVRLHSLIRLMFFPSRLGVTQTRGNNPLHGRG